MKFVVLSVNADDENVKIFSKIRLNVLQGCLKLFSPLTQIQSVAHPEHPNKF